MASATKLHQSVISDLESEKRQPTLGQLLQLARALDVPLQWFLTGLNQVGNELADNASQLRHLGIADLHVENENIPGAYRSDEDLIALAVSGNAPSARIIEAMPAVLAWNSWRPAILLAFASVHDDRASCRLGWLADIVLTIHANQGFPGGCKSRQALEEFIRFAERKLPEVPDTLGYAAGSERLPPISLRWKIQYPAPLTTFRERAEHLRQLRSTIH